MAVSEKPITLIATLGSSPAILTEALHAFYSNGYGLIENIQILSTTHGIQRLKKELLRYDAGQTGAFYRWCADYDIAPHAIEWGAKGSIQPVMKDDGQPLSDIRSGSEDRAFATAVFEAVGDACTGTDSRVYGLLSGGRKTMGSHLQNAFQLYGRSEDRLFHVLVDPVYESHPDFYYPTPHDHLVPAADGGPPVNFRHAQIDLVEVSYIRLRRYIQKELDLSQPYDELLSRVNEKLKPASDHPIDRLLIDLERNEIYINDSVRGMAPAPRPLALLTHLLLLRKHRGLNAITWADIVNDVRQLEGLHIVYRSIKLGLQQSLTEEHRTTNFEAFAREDNWYRWDYWHDEQKRVLKKDFSVKRAQLFRQLREELEKKVPYANATVDDIISFDATAGRAVHAVLHLTVPAGVIEVRGLDQSWYSLFDIENGTTS